MCFRHPHLVRLKELGLSTHPRVFAIVLTIKF